MWWFVYVDLTCLGASSASCEFGCLRLLDLVFGVLEFLCF